MMHVVGSITFMLNDLPGDRQRLGYVLRVETEKSTTIDLWGTPDILLKLLNDLKARELHQKLN